MIRAAALAGVTTLLFASPAFAEDEATTLATQLDEDVAALSTSNCETACKALASIRRAADRICALEPNGERCSAARTKAADATKRVHDACPECVQARLEAPKPEAPQATAPEAQAPPAEQPRGGCRSCTTAPALPDAGDLAAFALAVAAVAARRRRAISR